MRSPAQWLRLATSYRRIFSSVSSSYRSHSILSLFHLFLFLLLAFSSPLFPPLIAHILYFLFFLFSCFFSWLSLLLCVLPFTTYISLTLLKTSGILSVFPIHFLLFFCFSSVPLIHLFSFLSLFPFSFYHSHFLDSLFSRLLTGEFTKFWPLVVVDNRHQIHPWTSLSHK